MTSAQFLASPKVTFFEDDQSGFAAGLSSSSAAIVAPFKRGPDAAKVTTQDEFLELFEVSTEWGFGGHAALHYLEEGNQLTVIRVQKDARRAGMLVHNNVFSAFDNTSISAAMPFPFGSFKDYESGSRQFVGAAITGTFVISNSIAITLFDGTNTYNATALFNTDHNTTVRAIVDAINAIINTGLAATVAPGGASAVAIGGVPLNYIQVLSPEGKTFDLNLVCTGGAGQPTFAIAENVAAQHKLLEFYAENSGAHGNNLGIKFTNIKNGSYKQLTLTFNADFVSLNNIAFNFTYNGQTSIINVVYASSHANTIALIGTTIQTLIGVSGTVLVDATARTIKILSPTPGQDNISATTPLVTLGASQATCVVTTAAAVDNDDTFNVEIYTRRNQVVPKKTYTVSLRKITDGFGNSLYIEDVINRNADKSLDIRVNHYETNLLGQLKNISESTIWWFNGGTDGTLPSSSDIANGWELLKDRVLYPDIRMLINGGFADATVQTKMISVAETRKNSVAILDVPSASQETTAAVTYRNSTLNANTSFAIIATNDPEITDPFTSRRTYVPPSGKVAAAIARTLNIAPYLSPAGLNRGQILGIVGVRYNYSEGNKDTLAQNQINPILNLQGFGYVLWDALTLQKKASVMSYASSRFNMIYIQDACEKFFPFLLQEPIDNNLFYKIRQFGDALFGPMVQQGALRAGRIIADNTNNKSADVDAATVRVRIELDFPRPARSIVVTFVPVKSGAISFTESNL